LISMASAKPRIQRFRRFNAPMHLRQKFAHAHVSKELKQRLSLRKRAVQIRKGDTVKIMAGDNKGKSGKVTSVNLKTGKIFIDGVARKNSKNKDVLIPIYASNLYLTDLDLNDKMRKAEVEKKAAK
jgi:large subunit ribosomal protein L24